MKRVFILVVVVLLGAGSILFANYLLVHRHLGVVLKEDVRNSGIEVWAHYSQFLNPKSLVFDLREVSATTSPADVFRVLLQFSEVMEERDFDDLTLSYAGTPKFRLKGDYFKKLGVEYSVQNPVYTMRTFPENVFELDGTQAFNEWSGGILGVAARQMDDFGEFHKRWYISDIAKSQ